MSVKEEDLVSSRRGKWSDPGVPHKGWKCVGIEDLGDASMVCEMCEAQEIRFVHHMTHHIARMEMSVGCVCAGNMEGNLNAARNRDERMRNRALKRKRWLQRRWKISSKGSFYLKSDDFHVTVFRTKLAHLWSYLINDPSGQKFFAPGSYRTPDEAKLAAFDRITKLITHF